MVLYIIDILRANDRKRSRVEKGAPSSGVLYNSSNPFFSFPDFIVLIILSELFSLNLLLNLNVLKHDFQRRTNFSEQQQYIGKVSLLLSLIPVCNNTPEKSVFPVKLENLQSVQ